MSLSLCVSLQFLLLLGCFALFWSLYYTLEVVLADVDLRALLYRCRRWASRRARRGHEGKGVEESLLDEEYRDQEEQDSVVDYEANRTLLNGAVLEA